MKEEIDCIFYNNNFECDLGNNAEKCYQNCKDRESYKENNIQE